MTVSGRGARCGETKAESGLPVQLLLVPWSQPGINDLFLSVKLRKRKRLLPRTFWSLPFRRAEGSSHTHPGPASRKGHEARGPWPATGLWRQRRAPAVSKQLCWHQRRQSAAFSVRYFLPPMCCERFLCTRCCVMSTGIPKGLRLRISRVGEIPLCTHQGRARQRKHTCVCARRCRVSLVHVERVHVWTRTLVVFACGARGVPCLHRPQKCPVQSPQAAASASVWGPERQPQTPELRVWLGECPALSLCSGTERTVSRSPPHLPGLQLLSRPLFCFLVAQQGGCGWTPGASGPAARFSWSSGYVAGWGH